jgi:gluconolactonase
VHTDGSIWFTDPDWLFEKRPDDMKELSGQFVFRFDIKKKTLTKVAEGFDKPNGIAFSPDEKHLFLADTGTPNLYRFPVRSDGSLGNREIIATFNERGLDGLAIDAAGQLWCSTKNGIRILSRDGKLIGLVQTPGKPTSIAFGNEGRICVTTRDACYVAQLQ